MLTCASSAAATVMMITVRAKQITNGFVWNCICLFINKVLKVKYAIYKPKAQDRIMPTISIECGKKCLATRGQGSGQG